MFVFHLSLFSHTFTDAQGYDMELCEPAVFFKSSTSVKNGLTWIRDYNSQDKKKPKKHPLRNRLLFVQSKKFAMRNLARLKIMKDPLHMYCVSEISIECSHNHWTWDVWDDNGLIDLDCKENPGTHRKQYTHIHTHTNGESHRGRARG